MYEIKDKISVIICAYNEAENIGKVLSVLKKIKWLDEIIVVDDHSADSTSSVTKKFGVKVIRHPQNQGKGGAMATGIENARNDLLLFLDADLLGLTEEDLLKLLAPVAYTHEAKMSLGIFAVDKFTATNIANHMFPEISGQRAVWRKYLPKPDEIRNKKFGVDIFISESIGEKNTKVVELPGLSQVIKEQKVGLFQGLKNRFKMYGQIFKAKREYKKENQENRKT